MKKLVPSSALVEAMAFASLSGKSLIDQSKATRSGMNSSSTVSSSLYVRTIYWG